MRRYSTLRRGKPLKPGKPLAQGGKIERSAKLRPVNPERRAKRFMETFHSPDFLAWIRTLDCVVVGCNRRNIQAMHVRSRGAGGKWDEVVPACADHHAESHTLGIRTFASKYALDLPIIARVHASVWTARMADLPGQSSDDAGAEE